MKQHQSRIKQCVLYLSATTPPLIVCDYVISVATASELLLSWYMCTKHADDNNINDNNYKINVAFCHIGKW